jgi:hypothetical protein
MSWKLLLIGIFLMTACSEEKKAQQSEPSDDYVLIEFASKLEEDYHRINKIPMDSHPEETSSPAHP